MIKADLSGEIPHMIKSVTNVIGFLVKPKAESQFLLRPSEVNRLLGKVDELELSKEHVAIPYTVGESIKVVDGPFGFTGSIEHVNEENANSKLW